MKRLRFHEFGAPSVLRLEEADELRATPGDAVVAVRAASINPSDVGNVAGRFPRTTLPRTPGRDYAGIVVQGPSEWLGAEVWGTGDAGFARDGSHAEQIAVPVASLRRKPERLSFAEAASVGVTFAAAWLGVIRSAALQAGETLVVIGARGGVGSAGVQIGHAAGARVIGVDVAPPLTGNPVADKAEWLTGPDIDIAALVREVTGGRGADVVLNAVGGGTFEPSLRMLAYRGRLAVLASPGKRRQEFDLLDFYHNESQMFGVDTLAHDMVASAAILDCLTEGFENGRYAAPVVDRVVDLQAAVDAYEAVAAGRPGRVVLSA
jgi:NADPH:quinone reductase-like Zn-dependent oxidoreductase